ncbi:outer membrane protein assembly factor BamD [Thermodesulfobacteriota bacterium]
MTINHIKKSALSLLLLLPLLASTLLTGCGTEEIRLENEAEILAQEGLDNYNRGKYYNALDIFEKLKDRYPFSPHSLLAELKVADCNYFMGEYEEAILDYQEFEKNHPTNEAIPYVLFQIGMSHFQLIGGIDQDPGSASAAIQAFRRLSKTYPDSPYITEATQRINKTKNFLAAHEMKIASYYTRTGELKQAEGRLRDLLVNYPDSHVAPEAQELLARIEAGNPPKRPWYLWIPGMSIFFD